MNMYVKSFGIFLVAAGAVGAFFTSEAAEAKWTRYSALGCTSTGNWQETQGSIRNPSGGLMAVNCELSDDDRFAKTELDTVRAHGYKPSGGAQVFAQVCVSYWHTAGGWCGPTASTASSGSYALEPSLSALNSSHFGYLRMMLPTNAQLHGVFAFD